MYVVGYVVLAGLHLCLYDGVAAGAYVYGECVVDDGAYVAALEADDGEGEEAVEACYEEGVALYLGDDGLEVLYEAHVYALLYLEYACLGCEDFCLVLFQLGCDVPLGLCEGLLACPLLWDDVAVCVPHFEVVSEDVVVAYFERLYPCALCLTLLQLHEVVL